ncbi:hypothetical protein D1007_43454 [Hordeum vulgare]|nr:hypothetical protein D1007_43454 [Hordeum vulgare]
MAFPIRHALQGLLRPGPPVTEVLALEEMKAACLLLACVRCAGTGPARPIRRRAPPTLVLLKMLNYAVEYRGVKTKEEKGVEQIEGQRVIEAQIRMRHQELQDDAERLMNKQVAASTNEVTTARVEPCDTGGTSTSAGYVVYRRVLRYYSGEEDGLDMRKALSQDVDKKSIIPLKRPITPGELEYD